MQQFDLKRFRTDKKITQAEIAELFSCKQNFISNIENGIKPIPQDKLDILQSKFGDISEYYLDISPKKNTTLKDVSPEEFMLAGADAFSRQIVKMMNDKLIAPYGMLAEKEIEIEKLNRLVGKLQAEIEELKKGNAQTVNPAKCANAV
jgi:transcriptional regulator with XRE-family HTH domain